MKNKAVMVLACAVVYVALYIYVVATDADVKFFRKMGWIEESK